MDNTLFQYLRVDVDQLLTDNLPPHIAPYINPVVPSSATDSRRETLPCCAAHYILKSYLLQAYPFQTNNPKMIRAAPNTRRTNNRSCSDRNALLGQIIHALWAYESTRVCIDQKLPSYEPQGWYDEPSAFEDALLKIMEAVDGFQRLRQHGALSESARYLRDQTVDEAFATISEVVHIVTTAPSLSAESNVKRARETLDQHLQAVFDKYVPEANKQDRFYAIASILSHFGIEQGTPIKIAERLRKRCERSHEPINADS